MRENFSLSYIICKVGKNILVNETTDHSFNDGVYGANNEIPVLNDMSTSQDNKDKANENTYICLTPDIENTMISYNNNQPVESNA